jgi:hypothetical protein
MKKWMLLAFLLSQPSFAELGPGDGGGGTNLFEDELVDFVKFKEQYGDVIHPMNPEKFKAKGEKVPVLVEVRPALERLAYFYPGASVQIDATFKKPWVIVNKEFVSRRTGERMVVSQTTDAIFLNMAWLKKANQEKLRQVFVHEAVRNWATSIVGDTGMRSCGQYDSSVKKARETLSRKYADKFTEALTPLVYKKLQFELIDRAATAAAKEMHEEVKTQEQEFARAFREKTPNSNCYMEDAPYIMYSRKDMYQELRGTQPRKIIERICKPLQNSKLHMNDKAREKLVEEALDSILSKMPGEYFTAEYNNRDCAGGVRLTYANNMSHMGIVDITRYVGALAFPAKGCPAIRNSSTDPGRDFRIIATGGMQFYCGAMRNEQQVEEFLRRWEQDGGEFRDPDMPKGLEELPDEARAF